MIRCNKPRNYLSKWTFILKPMFQGGLQTYQQTCKLTQHCLDFSLTLKLILVRVIFRLRLCETLISTTVLSAPIYSFLFFFFFVLEPVFLPGEEQTLLYKPLQNPSFSVNLRGIIYMTFLFYLVNTHIAYGQKFLVERYLLITKKNNPLN